MIPWIFVPGCIIYYSPVTFNHLRVPSTQTDFSVLVDLTNSRFKSVGNGGHVSNSNGYDITAYADPGRTIPISYELEAYDSSTGRIIMWIKVGSLSSLVDTTIYLSYGDCDIDTNGSSASAWDSNFLGVYHLGNGSTLDVSNSSSMSHGPNLGNNNLVTATTGQLYGGANFVSASSQSLEDPGGEFDSAAQTCSAWVYANSFHTGLNAIFGRGFAGIEMMSIGVRPSGFLRCYINTDGGIISYDFPDGINVLSTGTWYHLALTYDSSSGLTGYVNGSVDKNVNGVFPAKVFTVATYIGGIRSIGSYWDGIIDEPRYSRIARSADWLRTEYNNQSDVASFETLGTEVRI